MTLAAYITQHMRKPFIWGENDCVLFAAGWVNLKTGKNYLADIERWDTMIEAQRILKEGGGLEAMVDARLEKIHPNFAQDGDIALHQDSLRLFSGRHIVGPGDGGLVFFNRKEAKCAWRSA